MSADTCDSLYREAAMDGIANGSLDTADDVDIPTWDTDRVDDGRWVTVRVFVSDDDVDQEEA